MVNRNDGYVRFGNGTVTATALQASLLHRVAVGYMRVADRPNQVLLGELLLRERSIDQLKRLKYLLQKKLTVARPLV